MAGSSSHLRLRAETRVSTSVQRLACTEFPSEARSLTAAFLLISAGFMDINSIFFNQFNRLRSGWRFAIFLAAFIFFATLLGILVNEFIAATVYDPMPVFLAVNAVVSLVLGWLCGKFLDGVPFRTLGAWLTEYWARHLGLGLLIGALTVGFAVLLAIVFGGLSFRGNPNAARSEILTTFLLSFLIFAVAAAFEESLFRGYMLQTFSRAGIAWLAIALTSIFFGVVHLGNPNAGAISSFNTALAGVWFGIAYLKTRDLWFVWGMHLMWNWVQGAIFGIEVSGLTDITAAPLLLETDRGPVWLTGENYGIEGGIVTTAAILLSTAAIHFLPILKPSEEMLALTSTENAEART